jgi:hypothetical protein
VILARLTGLLRTEEKRRRGMNWARARRRSGAEEGPFGAQRTIFGDSDFGLFMVTVLWKCDGQGGYQGIRGSAE